MENKVPVTIIELLEVISKPDVDLLGKQTFKNQIFAECHL